MRSKENLSWFLYGFAYGLAAAALIYLAIMLWPQV